MILDIWCAQGDLIYRLTGNRKMMKKKKIGIAHMSIWWPWWWQ